MLGLHRARPGPNFPTFLGPNECPNGEGQPLKGGGHCFAIISGCVSLVQTFPIVLLQRCRMHVGKRVQGDVARQKMANHFGHNHWKYANSLISLLPSRPPSERSRSILLTGLDSGNEFSQFSNSRSLQMLPFLLVLFKFKLPSTEASIFCSLKLAFEWTMRT